MDNVGLDGSLDTDKLVRALLMHRNTPDPGCKLSPAQVLLGRPLRDSLPYLNKHIMAFNNPQVHRQWRDAWEAKEDALRTRYVKTLENLSEHSRPLPPLRHGDHVMLQNQRGRSPKKWDHSGVVVETKPNDQYVVRIAGSGRLTLRNRRFLRKFTPHFSSPTVPSVIPSNGAHSGSAASLPGTSEPIQSPPTRHATAVGLPSVPEPGSQMQPPFVSGTPPALVPPSTPVTSAEAHPMRLSFGDLPESPSAVCSPESTTAPETVSSPPPVVFSPPLPDQCTPQRPRRDRVQRTCYDAASGTYKPPSSVPDDM